MSYYFSSTRFVKKYLTGIFLVLCLIILSVFLGFNYKANTLIKEQLQRQGKAFFQEIVLTRQWIASHGGVYVKLTPGMEVNPYLLKVPGLDTVVTAENGQRYTLKNPALITREISTLADGKGLFTFHITSLNPLNPGNAPDTFEKEALARFAGGADEYFRYIRQGKDITFRYMAPLRTEKACLQCHEFQGYQEGDVRGGISVSIPATDMMREMRENRTWLITSALGIFLLISGLIVYISRAFIKDLRLAEGKLMEMASKDFLTGLLNRREAYNRLGAECARSDRSGKTMGVLLLDVDQFKQVNDVHGHAIGDQVLQELAGCMQEQLREYDVLCRFGGEEFLVALQDTEAQCIRAVAERLRAAISRLKIPLPHGGELNITASIGVTERHRGETIDQAISRADTALYKAKEQGRDRVVVLYPEPPVS